MATKTDGAAATTGGVADGGDQQAQLQEDWTAFVKWFRSNGGIISSKLTVKVRNGRQGVYFKERMRRGETIVSFPRNLRLDEKTAMKGKAGHCLLYTSPSPRDATLSRMPSSA